MPMFVDFTPKSAEARTATTAPAKLHIVPKDWIASIAGRATRTLVPRSSRIAGHPPLSRKAAGKIVSTVDMGRQFARSFRCATNKRMEIMPVSPSTDLSAKTDVIASEAWRSRDLSEVIEALARHRDGLDRHGAQHLAMMSWTLPQAGLLSFGKAAPLQSR